MYSVGPVHTLIQTSSWAFKDTKTSLRNRVFMTKISLAPCNFWNPRLSHFYIVYKIHHRYLLFVHNWACGMPFRGTHQLSPCTKGGYVSSENQLLEDCGTQNVVSRVVLNINLCLETPLGLLLTTWMGKKKNQITSFGLGFIFCYLGGKKNQ